MIDVLRIIDGWTDGWTDRQTDRQTDRSMSLVSSCPCFPMHTSMLPHLRASDGHHLRSKSIAKIATVNRLKVLQFKGVFKWLNICLLLVIELYEWQQFHTCNFLLSMRNMSGRNPKQEACGVWWLGAGWMSRCWLEQRWYKSRFNLML